MRRALRQVSTCCVSQHACPVCTSAAASRRHVRTFHGKVALAQTASPYAAVREPLHVVRLAVPVLQQLRVEEALFRADSEKNWLVINHHQDSDTVTTDDDDPMAWRQERSTGLQAVVMGLGGGRHPDRLVHTEAALDDGVPLIKRFSGGGTVLVDHNTVCVAFVVRRAAVPHVQMYPASIMQWSADMYSGVFPASAGFSLQEHDYCFGVRKFGGNAQSIGKGRWLHHTSFLWDLDASSMHQYLRMPDKRPDYRADRDHGDFVCRMTGVDTGFSCVHDFVQAVVQRATEAYFSCAVETPLSTPWLQALLATPHDQRTTVMSAVDVEATRVHKVATDGQLALHSWRHLHFSSTRQDRQTQDAIRCALSVLQDPDALTHLPWGRLAGPEEAVQWLTNFVREPQSHGHLLGLYSQAQPDSARCVGFAVVHSNREHKEAQLGYALIPSARGKGLGTTCVHLLVRWIFSDHSMRHLEAIHAGTDGNNPGSCRVLVKAGFRAASPQDPGQEQASTEDTERLFVLSRCDWLDSQTAST